MLFMRDSLPEIADLCKFSEFSRIKLTTCGLTCLIVLSFPRRVLAKVVLNRHSLVNGCKLSELRMKQESLCREMVRFADHICKFFLLHK